MNRLWIFSFSLFLFFLLLEAAVEKRQTYIVYMGAIPSGSNAYSLKESHLQVLSSALQKRRKHEDVEARIVHRYKHGFSGFAAKLTKEEALAISKKKGVVSVFADPIYQLHTTHSWEFLETSQPYQAKGKVTGTLSDTIVGVLDTGVYPASESFDDTDMTAIPARWKGSCDFLIGSKFTCNKKLIGARFYNLTSGEGYAAFLDSDSSPLDDDGHGTHTSSITAGTAVKNANYYGLANGVARGGSTSSRIAMYKVCTSEGCPGSAILHGMDDAIADGVDLMSVSFGASATYRPDFLNDPIAIGALHAELRGITVVSSAGNDGPDDQTVVNAAPWLLTVAASTIDRHFESDIVLGRHFLSNLFLPGVPGNLIVKGEAINFSNLSRSAIYPLIDGGSAGATSIVTASEDASHCEPGSLDPTMIKGRIVLCKHSLKDSSSKIDKAMNLQKLEAVGAIFEDETRGCRITAYISFPVSEINDKEAAEIRRYMRSTNEITPVPKTILATIRPSVTVIGINDPTTQTQPAPAIAYFSSRGPSPQTKNILKPDIAAPGVNILGSWIPESGSEVPPGYSPSTFSLQSGTSMASPHVAAVAAVVKSVNPSWSPSAIRSAIMTTASIINSHNTSILTDRGEKATPFDFGAGELNPDAVADPGLVYEIDFAGYVDFLCNYGYDNETIYTMVNGDYVGSDRGELSAILTRCNGRANYNSISNLNYPSISISNFKAVDSRVVTRTLTYVPNPTVPQKQATTYTGTVELESMFNMKLDPAELTFSSTVNKQSYQLTISAASTGKILRGNYFGSITWTDGQHNVRSPIVIVCI